MSTSSPHPADLPNAELDILAHLWAHGPATARQVREALAPHRPMAHGSAVTLLRRLEEKKLVSRKKADHGKAYVYTPTKRPEPTYRRLVRELSDRVFGGNPVALVASLFDSTPPTPQQVEQLKQLLKTLKNK